MILEPTRRRGFEISIENCHETELDILLLDQDNSDLILCASASLREVLFPVFTHWK